MSTSVPISALMPEYRCHKTVRALRIAQARMALLSDPDEVRLDFADEGFDSEPAFVPKIVVARYFPQPGDYYVVYADGYQSISPAAAFEEGYTRLSDPGV